MRDPIQVFERHANHLNGICEPARTPKVFYDMFSGGLVWSDETCDDTPFEMINALRFLFAYRTGLMLGQANPELEGYWQRANELFPDWVGFLPERRQPNSHLLEIYREGERQLDACLKNWEKESS